MNVAPRYLDGAYLEANPDWHEAHSSWKAHQIDRILSRNKIDPRTICEVGCGAGGIIAELSATRPETEFVGYDISPDAMAFAQSKVGPNREYRLGDPFEQSGTYDVALAIDVFEHVEDFFGFLRNMRKVAKRQIYHIPLDLTVQALIVGNSMMRAREHSGHIHYFYKDTALAALRETGHSVRDWFYTCGAIDLPGDSIKRRIAAVPRRLAYKASPDFAARVLGGFSMLVLCE